MSIEKLPYRNLYDLLKENLFKYEFKEDENTKCLIKKMSKVKREKGYLTKSNLIEICYWKMRCRKRKYIEQNSDIDIRNKTQKSFYTSDEKYKIELLDSLKGIGIGMASSILMLTDSNIYPVLDIRVWQVLHKLKNVYTNRKGLNFKPDEYIKFLDIVRSYSKKFNVNARDIERTIFSVHKLYVKGNLY